MRRLKLSLIVLFVGFFLFSNSVNSQTATAPAAGNGSVASPYQIASLNNLYWIYVNSSEWDANYIQTANIDASSTSGWFGGEGWYPIGNATTNFSGTYDGQGYTISSLFIGEKAVEEDNIGVGLFGYTTSNSRIHNLSISNINYLGYFYVGGIAGDNRGEIFNCHSSGFIFGIAEVGGLVGSSKSGAIISSCSSSVDVEGESPLGNLVGYNEGDINLSNAENGSVKGLSSGGIIGGLVGLNYGDIEKCFTNTTVTSSERVNAGGLTGENYGGISNSFSQGPVSGSGTLSRTGGLVGFLRSSGTISNSYSTSYLSGNNRGGLVSRNDVASPYSNVTNSFWCTTLSVSNATSSQGGTGTSQFNLRNITTYTGAGWAFACETWGINGSNNNQYPFLLWQNDYGYLPGDCNYWTGSTSTDWATSNNWVAEEAPASTDNTLIRGGLTNYPEISSNTTINLIHIGNNDAKLTINAGASLTVSENLINNSDVDGLVLKSTSASNSAAVILTNSSNVAVPATVERYVTPSSTNVLFHLVSSPVSGQSIAEFISDNSSVIAYSPSGGVYAMKPYKTDGTGWDLNYTGTETSEVIPGTTYSIGIKRDATTLTFKGDLVNSNQTFNIIGTGTGFGWNGIGNPFAASLNAKADANSFLTKYGDQLDASYYGLYVWNPSTSQYEVVNGTPLLDVNYLASAQGFIVKGTSGGGSVTFERGMRAIQSPTFYKAEGESTDWFSLVLQVKNASEKIITTSLAFNQEMTNGLDVGFDAGHLSESADYKVYTRMPEEGNDLNLIIQALPNSWTNSQVIPVGLVYQTGGVVEFSAASISLPDDVIVRLEDRELNQFIDISSEVYSVELAAGTNTNERFYLHLVSQPTIATNDGLTFCEGEEINVTIIASPAEASYQWYNGDQLIPDATFGTYTATEPGSYSAEVTLFGLELLTEPVVVVENPNPDITLVPETVEITSQEEQLFDAGDRFDSYLWFDGSKEQTYLFVGSEWEIGSYDVWVEVTNEFGCASRDSSIVVVGTTGIDQNVWTMNIYPNPSNGKLNLSINGLLAEGVKVSIINTTGQVVYQKEFIVTNGELQELIDLQGKAKGVHVIQINDGLNTITRRIIFE